MQDKNQTDVRKILLALADHLNVDKIRGLAERLTIPEGTMYAWIKRGNIGNTGAILGKLPYICLEWLKTGEGHMMVIDDSNRHLLPPGKYAPDTAGLIKPKIAPRIEPDNDRQKARPAKKTPAMDFREKMLFPEEENFVVSDMLVMTSRVLESGTVYRSALASNIRAFYQAVENEDEMNKMSRMLENIQEENQAMAEQMRIMAERMERMEKLLAKEADEPQKRDQATG